MISDNNFRKLNRECFFLNQETFFDINFRTLTAMSVIVIVDKIVTGNQTVTKPAPLIMMSFRAIINHFVGIMCANTCNGIGMFSRGKINPDRSKAGKNNPSIHNIMATCCDSVITEINMPKAHAVNINRIHTKASKMMLPSMGILNIKIPKTITMTVQIREIIIYGIILATTIVN